MRSTKSKKSKLLPNKSPQTPQLPGVFSWNLWAALVCTGILLVALRTPMDWLHPTFYAEDGMIFFERQCIDGWHAIFQPYNGYFHLLPRLITMAASAAPVSAQPFLFSLASAAIQSLAASFFFLPENRIFVRSDSLRSVVCILALIDFQAYEMLNSAMYVQWFLFPVALMMLCHLGSRKCPLSRSQVLFYSLLMVPICLSTPLLLFTLPLAIYFLVRSPMKEKAIPALMIASLLVQAVAFVKTSVPEPKAVSGPVTLFLVLRPWVATMGAWVYRDVFTIILGEPAARTIAAKGGETFAAVTLLMVVLAIQYLSPKFPRDQRILFITAVVTSIGLAGTSMVFRHLVLFVGDLTHYDFFGGGSRYFFLSGWILLVAGAMAIERQFANWSQFGRAAILLAVFGFGALNNFAVPEISHARWSQYAPAIEEWKLRRDRHEHAHRVVAPIYPPPWEVVLPPI